MSIHQRTLWNGETLWDWTPNWDEVFRTFARRHLMQGWTTLCVPTAYVTAALTELQKEVRMPPGAAPGLHVARFSVDAVTIQYTGGNHTLRIVRTGDRCFTAQHERGILAIIEPESMVGGDYALPDPLGR